MSKFALMVFADQRKAYEGVHALQQLHAEGSLTVWGTDVLQRDADGKVTFARRDDQGPLGAGLGALAGGLVGLFGGPVGAAVGVAVGATAGGVSDLFELGVSDEFLAAVERDLAPGKVAVIAEVSEDWIVPLDTRMEELGTKVVREDRLAFAEDALEKRVKARKARLAELKAERAKHRAERVTELQTLLTAEVEEERRKLRSIAEKSEKRLDGARQELNAKIEALRAQASEAGAEARSRIEERMAEVRRDFAEREQKLKQARELTRQALHP